LLSLNLDQPIISLRMSFPRFSQHSAQILSSEETFKFRQYYPGISYCCCEPQWQETYCSSLPYDSVESRRELYFSLELTRAEQSESISYGIIIHSFPHLGNVMYE